MNKAPSFFLTAIGAARIVGGPPGPATPLLLVFHGYSGSETAFNINASVRAQYPGIDQIFIASVIDLHHIPRYMRSAVELTLSAAYRQSAKRIPENLDPTEYVVIVPDWEGKVTREFGMDQRINDIGIVLIISPWVIFDSYSGLEPLAAIDKMLAAAANDPSAPTLKPAPSA